MAGGAGGAGGAAPLSGDAIVTAAIALVDVHGLSQLTMRRLGASLGVEAMSLYRYFPSRESLVDGLVEAVVMQTATDPALQLVRGDDWRDYLHRLAHGTRRMALTHPRVFPLIATHPTQAPWIKPPMRSLAWVDAFLAGLEEHHFPPPAAVSVYKQFSTFMLGHLLLEVAALGLDHAPLSSSPPPPPDPVKRQAERQRGVDAAAAEAVTVDGAAGVDAAEVLASSTGRTATLGDEPAVELVETALRSAPHPGSDVGTVITASVDVPITAAVVSTVGLPLTGFPTVEAMAGLLAHDTAARDFDETLSTLIDRFALLRRP